MLTSLHIENFKAWKDTGPVRLAPLTVFFGANSAGKSSLGHLLLALKQTVMSSERKRPLQLGDENSLIELGTFEECVHNHDLKTGLHFNLGWRLPETLQVQDPVSNSKFAGDQLQLDVHLLADKHKQPAVAQLEYDLRSGNDSVLSVTFSNRETAKLNLSAGQYHLVRNTGRDWPLEEADKFYRISDQSRARYQNAEFLADFALETEAVLRHLYYLGPLRDYPKRLYSWSGESPESVGMKGESAIAAILAASAKNRTISRGLNQRALRFDRFIAQWLKDLGIIDSFSVTQVAAGRKEYEVLVKTHAHSNTVKMTDAGFGVSQVLPALVQAFYCPSNSTVWMEQPEIHLHPQVQSGLADVFIAATRARENRKDRRVQLIIESHSEHFLNRLQRRIAEGALNTKDVAIYFCNSSAGGTELSPLHINEDGEIENWPDNFFGDEMAEITARTTAALKRRMAKSGA